MLKIKLPLVIFLILLNSKVFCNDNINTYYQQGIKYQNSESFNEAISSYLKAKSLLTSEKTEINAFINWNLQFCYSKINDYNNALNACRAWINSGYYLGNAYYNMGVLYWKKGDLENAKYCYNSSITNFSDVYIGFELDINSLYRDLKSIYIKSGSEYSFVPKSEFNKVILKEGLMEFSDRELDYNELITIAELQSADAQLELAGVKTRKKDYSKMFNTKYLSHFAISVSNSLPISIKAVVIELNLYDNLNKLIYQQEHTVWLDNLTSGYKMTSKYSFPPKTDQNSH